MSLIDTPAEALVGPARIALNHSTSSIHDAEHAKRLGFRGSAVGGNLHLDLFAPLLVQTFGQEWFLGLSSDSQNPGEAAFAASRSHADPSTCLPEFELSDCPRVLLSSGGLGD